MARDADQDLDAEDDVAAPLRGRLGVVEIVRRRAERQHEPNQGNDEKQLQTEEGNLSEDDEG